MSSQYLNGLSPMKRRWVGLALVTLGLLSVVLIYSHPEKLRAPGWVAYSAALSFVCAGIMVFVHALVSPRVYAWLAVGLLSIMSLVPAWVAFGSGKRECQSALPLFGELGCRIAFGVGAALMLCIVVLAVLLARRASSAS